MQGSAPATAGAEWRAHWRVAFSAMVGVSLSAAPAFGLAMFIQPLQDAFGWSRAGISLAMTITAGMGAAFAWAAGAVVDRVGARRVALVGVALFCAFYALLSQVTSDIRTWWLGWFMIGVAGLALQSTTWSKAVNSLFDKGRGVALALMASGTGVSTVILPSLCNYLIAAYGWRATFVIVGALYAAIILPMLWLWFFEAGDRDPAAADAQSRAERLRTLPGWTLHEGLRRRQTYQIAVAAMLAGAAVTGYAVHIVSMLTDKGIDRSAAAGMLSALGLLAVISRLVIGRIFDTVASPMVGIVSVSLPVIPGLIMLFLPPSPLTGLLAAASVGLAIGGEYDTVLYLSSRFFGQRSFGALFGTVASIMTVGFALGPLAAGLVHDLTGSYRLYFILTIPVTLVAVLLIATLGPYPAHATARRED